jgi:hypothetical protein
MKNYSKYYEKLTALELKLENSNCSMEQYDLKMEIKTLVKFLSKK